MKSYEYTGNLQEDIKKSKKKFDIKKFLLSELALIVFSFILSGMSSFLFGLHTLIYSFPAIMLILSLKNIVEISKETEAKAKITTKKLVDLYVNINENNDKELVEDLGKKRMKECVSRVDSVQKIHSYDMDTLKKVKKEEKITTYFYLLNPKDQLQVLKQVRNIIINKKTEFKCEEFSLYLLDEKDIKEENINIPVQKIIKLKTK